MRRRDKSVLTELGFFVFWGFVGGLLFAGAWVLDAVTETPEQAPQSRTSAARVWN